MTLSIDDLTERQIAKTIDHSLLKPELDQIRREGAQVDAKSSLQHTVQARWHEPPEYVTVQEAAGAQHRFIVEVRVVGSTLGRGEGRSKREAQQAAAQEALVALTSQSKAEA